MPDLAFMTLPDFSGDWPAGQDLALTALALSLILALKVRAGRRPQARNAAPPPAPQGRGVLASLWLRIVLLVAMALPMLVLYAISTLGPLLSRDLQFKPEWLGYLVLSSFGLASLLSLWAGAFVNRFGSRLGLMALFFAIALAFTLIVTVEGFYGLVAAAAICGIAQALANPVTNVLIAERVPPEKKAGVVGLKQAGVQVAALFAGLALPGIALAFGWRLALGLIIPVSLLFLATAPLVTPKAQGKKDQRFALTRPNPLLLRLMSVQCCVGLGLSAFVTFLPSFAARQGMPLAVAGSLIAVFGVMGILSRIVLTPLGAKLRDETWLLLALMAIAAGAMAVTMQASPESHWRLWAGAVGVGLTAVGTNAIAMSMLIRDPAAFGQVTVASGFVSVAFFGGFALGPPLYGALAGLSGGVPLGWSAMIGVLCCGCLLALGLISARRRKTGRIEREAPRPVVVAEPRFPAVPVFATAWPVLVLYSAGLCGFLAREGLRFTPEVLAYVTLGSVAAAALLSLLLSAGASRRGWRYALLMLGSGIALVSLLILNPNGFLSRFEDLFQAL